MKKLLFTFFVYLAFVIPISAGVLTTEESSSEPYIVNHGYSEEMARLIDLQNKQINGEEFKFKSRDPQWYSDKRINFIRNVFMYFDPGLDDGKFMQHNTKFTNSWSDLK